MFGRWTDWVPALMLAGGLVLVHAGASQQEVSLRVPLGNAVPHEIEEYAGLDVEVSSAEAAVAGADSQLMRTYRTATSPIPYFTVYIGYYASQRQGRTIHSPRNCLPGSGWEVIEHRRHTVDTSVGPLAVARYVVQRNGERALVLYWYQGRGRVEAGEYAVKVQLLRDATLRGRTEEALVRIMVPIEGDEAPAASLASAVASSVIPALYEALPEV